MTRVLAVLFLLLSASPVSAADRQKNSEICIGVRQPTISAVPKRDCWRYQATIQLRVANHDG